MPRGAHTPFAREVSALRPPERARGGQQPRGGRGPFGGCCDRMHGPWARQGEELSTELCQTPPSASLPGSSGLEQQQHLRAGTDGRLPSFTFQF